MDKKMPLRLKDVDYIGKGGFGTVYKYINESTHKLLAVKAIDVSKKTAATREEVKSLNSEIEILQKISHKRIVQYLGSYEENNLLYIFLEYMPGGSVRDQLDKQGPLTLYTIQSYTRQVLQGLEYLHSQGIVHRDIKCANILRSGSQVKIADFGTSKKLRTIIGTQTTGLNKRTGTGYYMAPEVVLADDKNYYNEKCDIWSLGCTIVEMYTAEHPYSGFTDFQALYKIGSFIPPKYELPINDGCHAQEFLLECFKCESERPTSSQLLEHKFVAENTDDHEDCTILSTNKDIASTDQAASYRKIDDKALEEQVISNVFAKIDEGLNLSMDKDNKQINIFVQNLCSAAPGGTANFHVQGDQSMVGAGVDPEPLSETHPGNRSFLSNQMGKNFGRSSA